MSSAHHHFIDIAIFDCLAKTALQEYPPEQQGNIKLMSLSENATYKITNKHGQCFALRIHRPGYHSYEAIESELNWLKSLEAAGIEVPKALPGKNQALIQVATEGKIQCWVVMFAWINGTEPDTKQNLNASFKRLGEVNAKLHLHTKQWQTPTSFQRLTWDYETMLSHDAHWGRWQDAPYVDKENFALIDETVSLIERKLQSYGKDRSKFGLIHADLRLANLLIENDTTYVIDFDDCGFGWYLHDLASALSFYEHHPKAYEWIQHWIEGYSKIIPLHASDLEILPSLIMQRRLQLVAWSGSHANTALAQSLGKEWMAATNQLCRDYLSMAN